ncbi:hypothetical protein LTR47_004630 [Exophiala xenobiotica]|nr:hypothetical protein LTR47_004630 [Exophiala xenobiotica]KAK5281909.1 hypothetical protein LTR40_004093 [Exophiala xenobiotica]KAK5325006.1 hypothetical protein LTR93_004481 [Exophiala xenobiotica]KAK5352720.1 hypothetical protein LTR61_003846 [Exophiala xenobiotica]KAK5375584.1 hypothetical protein LTR11_005134 [Exophiala xenobiotica]
MGVVVSMVLLVAAGAGIGVGVGFASLEIGCAVGITVVNGLQGWPEENGIPAVTIYDESDPAEGLDTPVLRDYEDRLYRNFSTTPKRVRITNNGFDTVCLAGVMVSYPDGQSITISGNFGKFCGAGHQESRRKVLSNNVPESCIWVDRHLRSNISIPGITLNLISPADENGNAQLVVTSDEELCSSPFVTMENRQEAPQKREESNISVKDVDFASRLIKSNLTMSSAVRMCEGKNTMGPNFLSLAEKLYCDMGSRELLPVCEDGTEGVCFDADQDEVVKKEGGSVETVKAFAHVAVW